MNDGRASDAQIFFTALSALTATLAGGELLLRWLASAQTASPATAIAARSAPLETIRPFYAFFVLLPVGLGFLAIGVPFLLRTLMAAVHRRVSRGEATGLAAVLIGAVALVVEARFERDGLATTLAITAVAGWQGRALLARAGERVAAAVLAAGGLSLVGLGYYERQLLAGVEQSMAIAPTLLLLAFFYLAFAVSTMAVAASRGSASRIVALLAAGASALWLASPVLRSTWADTVEAADRFEVDATLAAGTVLLLVGAIAWLRR